MNGDVSAAAAKTGSSEKVLSYLVVTEKAYI